ncbi:MAG TPA: septum formation initiator [Asanoa sp.]|nr:septum formation initiator [Asanoa sp.]
MPRRSLAVLGWLAVVIVATLAGVGALRLVGDSLASTPGGVRSQGDVARDLAAANARPAPSTAPPTATATPSSPTTAPTATAGPVRKTFEARGNTVIATCVDGLAKVVYYAAAQGYSVDDHDDGPEQEVEVKFRGPAGRSEIKIRCNGDQPVQSGHDD